LSSDGASCVDEKSAKSSKSSITPDQSTLLSPEFLPRLTEGDGGARFDGVKAAADVAAATQIA
jgi:hypothetical protein